MTENSIPVEAERHRTNPGGEPPPFPTSDEDRCGTWPRGEPASPSASAGPDALARLTVELGAMGRANAELLRVATEFQKLAGAIGGAREAVVATMVAGVPVRFPAAAVLGAKQTELRNLSDGWERTLLVVLTAIGCLMKRSEDAAAPIRGPSPGGAHPPARFEPRTILGGEAERGELFDEIAAALAGQAATRRGGRAADDARDLPLEPRHADALSAAEVASRFPPAGFRVRTPGKPGSADDAALTAR